MNASVVDLFCGIGGLSYGFRREGFSIEAGIDSDESCKYAYETNLAAPFLSCDIRDLSAARVNEAFRSDGSAYRILIGCAPCAPFSLYTRRYRKTGRPDRAGKWQLLREFLRLVEATRPDVVSMENVTRLLHHQIFAEFVDGLRNAGYYVTHFVVRADHYGVPQRRARLVLFASRLGEVQILPPTHVKSPVTVRDAIAGLPRLEAGAPASGDPLHVARGLTGINLRRIRSTGAAGSWRDWPDELKLKCHKKQKGRTFRSVYGRMRWDAPSPVITTQCLGIGNGRFGHPEQDRAISIREAALLQTFPRRFKFVAPGAEVYGKHLARQIGNAVPVGLARVIARSIRQHLASVERASESKRASRSIP